MKIKLTKFAAVDSPLALTPDDKNYNHGEINENVSIPIDYWIIGELSRPIQVGECVCVNREIRNGITIAGLFQTSPVVKFEKDIIETANSKYRIEYLINEETY